MRFVFLQCLLHRPGPSVCTSTRQTQHAADQPKNAGVNMPKVFSEIPQPKRLPLLGTMLDYTKRRRFDVDKLYNHFYKRHKELGPIYKENVLPGITECMVMTSSPKDVETLFRMNERYPYRPSQEYIALSRKDAGYGIGVINAQGDDWMQIRKLFNEHLLTNKSVWNYTSEHLNIALEFVDYIRSNLDEKNEIDGLNNLLYRWALECATVFTLDLRLGTFKGKTTPEASELIDVTRKIFGLWNELMTSPPLYKYFKYGKFKTLCEYQAQQYRAINNYAKSSSTTTSTLMDIVEKSDLPLIEKATIVPEVLGAAVDTTSNGAAFYLYALACNPEKQEILREEIKSFLDAGEITGKTLQRMKYLHAVHLETERLYPRVVGFPRKLPHDMVFSGYRVPKGIVVLSTANMINNRDPNYFDNPNEFVPERWLSAKDRKKFIMPGSFGMGARRCPGRMMAHQEIACLLIAFLSKFKIEYHHEPLDMSVRVTTALSKDPSFTYVPLGG